MLKAAGIGVAMINGSDEVKAVADYITTRDNNHDGVAEAADKFFWEAAED
jgi:hydroxymethylpyrimidine pyrophosphatase-like HAD family hydrolase